MEIHLKECDKSDIDLILKLSRETFFDSFSAMNTAENMDKYLAKAFNRKKIKAEIRDPDSTFFLLLLDNNAAGYLKINEHEAQTDLKDDSGLEIERVYIIAEFQGRGLGKVLMNKGIEIAQANKKEFVWLGVWDKNVRAIQFYEQMGFNTFTTHDFYLGDEKQTDILMKRILE